MQLANDIIYDEILDDVKTECKRTGRVISVDIPRPSLSGVSLYPCMHTYVFSPSLHHLCSQHGVHVFDCCRTWMKMREMVLAMCLLNLHLWRKHVEPAVL